MPTLSNCRPGVGTHLDLHLPSGRIRQYSLCGDPGIDWSMIYVGRSLESLPFADEVARFGPRVEIRTDDVHGFPTAAELLSDCPDGTAVYACGPAPMLTAIRARLAGRDNVELHFERFAAPPVLDGQEFAVSIASTGETVRVGADETLLSALRCAGVSASYSCQQGFCGVAPACSPGTSTIATRC